MHNDDDTKSESMRTRWLKITYPSSHYAISPQPVARL